MRTPRHALINHRDASGQFDCHFTGPEGKPYNARMRVTKVEGAAVLFDVNSRPS
ncbi:MAG: hypothetical protein K2X97_01565 [Mycobacteriaceae bacterium]|nr:hypothetical protein [Mycobacteriaceae bacterium]